MFKRLKYVLLFCTSFLGSTCLSAQREVDSANVKHPYGIYFAVGPSYSKVDIYSNYLTNPRRFGINPRLYWEFSNTFRINIQYTLIPKFNFSPSWERLHSGVTEVDLHIMARITEAYSIVYMIAGVCYNRWEGFYVKQSLFYDATKNYQPQTTISKSWPGINMGIGVERAFKYFELYGEYKYRFAKFPDAIGIADVTANIGIKKKIPFGKLFRGLKDKYHWF